MADKFKRRFKRKGKGKPKAHAERSRKKGHHEHDDKHHRDRHRDDQDKRKEQKEKRNKEILARAERELPSKIHGALAKRPRKLTFKARLLFWRMQYRLTALRVERINKHQFEIEAVVNPKAKLAKGFEYDRDELLKMLDRIAQDFWDKHFRTRAKRNASPKDRETAARNREASRQDLKRMSTDASAQLPAGDGPTFLPSRPTDDLRLAAEHRTATTQDVIHTTSVVDSSPKSQSRQHPGAGRFTETVDPVTNTTFGGLDYDEIVHRLKEAGHEPQAIGRALRRMQTGAGIPPEFAGQANELALLRNLMFNVEVQRDRRNMIFSPMAVNAMRQGVDPEDVLHRTHGEGLHPATPRSAAVGFTDEGSHVPRRSFAMVGGEEGVRAARDENRRRQISMLKVWFEGQIAGGNEPLSTSLTDLEKLVYEWVARYYQLHPPE